MVRNNRAITHMRAGCYINFANMFTLLSAAEVERRHQEVRTAHEQHAKVTFVFYVH